MQLRHAAALALVGWYLMVPPIRNGRVDKDAMSQWTMDSVHEKLPDCRSARSVEAQHGVKRA